MRWSVVILLGFGMIIAYIDRANLSVALADQQFKALFRLTDNDRGLLNSAFFWTYAFLQIPAGWLVDRFDVKWVFALGFLIWSLSTAVTGILHGFTAMLFIRVCVGAGESIAYPSYSKILADHFRGRRGGLANGVIAAGAVLGPCLGLLVGGTVVARFGWRPFFVVVGLTSLLWLVPWLAWMPRRKQVKSSVLEPSAGMPEILRQRSLWGTCSGLFCSNYNLYFLLTWLPFYLVRGRGLSMDHMARVGGAIFFVAAVSAIICGKLSDWWIAAGASATHVRKTLVIVGATGVGIFLIASVAARDSIFVWMLALVAVFLGMTTSNLWAITQTLAGPKLAGRWCGVQNFMGNLAGGIGPTLTGFLVDRTGRYQWPFFVAAGVAWMGALSWAFLVGPVEQVDWEREIRASRARMAVSRPTALQP